MDFFPGIILIQLGKAIQVYIALLNYTFLINLCFSILTRNPLFKAVFYVTFNKVNVPFHLYKFSFHSMCRIGMSSFIHRPITQKRWKKFPAGSCRSVVTHEWRAWTIYVTHQQSLVSDLGMATSIVPSLIHYYGCMVTHNVKLFASYGLAGHKDNCEVNNILYILTFIAP